MKINYLFKYAFKHILIVALAVILPAGYTLSKSPTPQSRWISHDDIFSIYFPTESEGWACGRWGTIMHTKDAGKTWHHQQSGTDFSLAGIYFVDSQTGWAVGNEAIIIHTTDGGKTWERQKSPVDYYHSDVFFVTAQKGWIVSDRTNILYTEDGGANWKVQFSDEEFRLKAISFSDENHGWAVGEYGYIYNTKNGGESWYCQGGFLRFNEETADVEGGTFLYDILAIDAMTAWAVGLDSHIIRTVDGGKSWIKVNTGIPPTQLFCIAHDGADKIVIGGRGIFLTSDDRGQTWEKALFQPHIEYSWIYDVFHTGSSQFIAGGENGIIYYSANKNIWQRIIY